MVIILTIWLLAVVVEEVLMDVLLSLVEAVEVMLSNVYRVYQVEVLL